MERDREIYSVMIGVIMVVGQVEIIETVIKRKADSSGHKIKAR